MYRLILCIAYFLFFNFYQIKSQIIDFESKNIFTKNAVDYTYNQAFYFLKSVAKGDSIIGLGHDFCRVSFDGGISWNEIDLASQQIFEDGKDYKANNKFSTEYLRIYTYKNYIILLKNNHFYISKDWRKFEKVNFKPSKQDDLNWTNNFIEPKINDNGIALISNNRLYLSENFINIHEIQLPQKVRVIECAIYKDDIYIMTLKNIYKSSDKGVTWNKIENIIYPYSIEQMASYLESTGSTFTDFEVFNNNIYIEYSYMNNYVYNLTDNSKTKLENIHKVGVKDDTLFLKTKSIEINNKITENGKIYFYKDVLSKLDVDLSEYENSGVSGKSIRGIHSIYLTNSLLIIDESSSINRKKVSPNIQNNIAFNGNVTKVFPNLIINEVKIIDNNQVLEANEKNQISFYIKNEGKGDANDIITKISNPNSINGILFNNPSIIRNLRPNDSVQVLTTINSDINLKNGNAKILFTFEEKNGFSPEPTEIDFETKEFIKPLIKIVDYAFITENGIINKGLPIKLKVILQNIGQGQAEQIKVNFNYPKTNVLPNSDNEFYFSELKPGESKEIMFEFITNKLYASNTIPIEILINEKYGSFAEDKEVYAQINGNSTISSVKIKGNYEEKNIQIIEQSLISDIDKDIPQNNKINNNRYALIIGNEDYSTRQTDLNNESNVEFALNDAKSFYEYSLKVLGIPKENCFLVLNATSGEMTHKLNVITQILTKLGDKAELIFYYAGHGFPDEVTKIPYLIPVDVSATNLQSAIKLSDLYQKFTDTQAKRISVFLDACFTGGGRNQGLLAVRGVKIKPKQDKLRGNLIVFTATNNEQSALPYKDKQHGMFTYYLLKKLKETNGQILYTDLQNYIQEQVSIQSLKVNSKSQDPQINVSPEILDVWENWRFN